MAYLDAVLSHRPPLSKEKSMNYAEKIERMDAHLARHPQDYQTVVARLKTVSDAYEHEAYKRRLYRLKRVAEVRRQLKEIENGRRV